MTKPDWRGGQIYPGLCSSALQKEDVRKNRPGDETLAISVIPVYLLFQESDMDSEYYKKGMKVLGAIGDPGGEIVAESLKAIENLAPGLSNSVVEFLYGDVYSREGLDMRSREIVAIAAQAVVGSNPQLTDHIITGLIVGLTKEERKEILVQIAFFAGFPAALEALKTASEVLPCGTRR